MNVVDFLFDTGQLIITCYSEVCDWFVSPIILVEEGDRLFGPGSWAFWLFDSIFGTNSSYHPSTVTLPFTPFELLVGGGLIGVLTSIAIKWIKSIIV